jgi:hypothetical protein
VNSGRTERKAKKQETMLTSARTAAKRPHAKLAEDLVTSRDGNVSEQTRDGEQRESRKRQRTDDTDRRVHAARECSPTQYTSTAHWSSGAACVFPATPSRHLLTTSDIPRDTKQPRPHSIRAQRLSSRSSSLLSPMQHAAHPPSRPPLRPRDLRSQLHTQT